MLHVRVFVLFALCATSLMLGATGRSYALSEQDLHHLEEQLKASRALEKTLEKKASGLGQEVNTLRKRLAAAARSAQDNEELLSALEKSVCDLKERKATIEHKLAQRHQSMSAVLGGIERLALRPPGVLMFQNGHQKDTVRGAILLRSAIPELKRRTDQLKEQLKRLADVRRKLATRQHAIHGASSGLDAQHKNLVTLYKRKKALVRHTRKKRLRATEKAQALARNARDMRDLLAKLKEERQYRERAANNLARQAVIRSPRSMFPDHGTSAENMMMPARGTLVLGYGDRTGEGLTTRGMTLRTRSDAQVVAPASGTVAFAGAFRGYGLLLIIEQPGDYHVLLSGMSRIEPVVGQSLRTGEPVGIMGRDEEARLYVELRRAGQPVNPLPWLSARKG